MINYKTANSAVFLCVEKEGVKLYLAKSIFSL